MNFVGAKEFLDSLGYSKTWDLQRMNLLSQRLGIDFRKTKFIHVTGSNGKGSVTSTVSQILKEEGYEVGTYTSPHLLDVRERIAFNCEMISEQAFSDLASEVKPAIELLKGEGFEVSEFEALTAMAFEYFTEKEMDFSVIEVGLGGMLDATNILPSPLVSIISSVSLEHTDRLGSTVYDIALDKAHVIKENCIAVTACEQPALQVVRKWCRNKGVKLLEVNSQNLSFIECDDEKTVFVFEGNEFRTSLLGRHQAFNSSCAISCINALREKGFVISEEAVRKGLMEVKWQGRLEVVSKKPLVVFDGAHNPGGVTALVSSVKEIWPLHKIILVNGILADKDYHQMVEELCKLKLSKVYCCTPRMDRGLDSGILKNVWEKHELDVVDCSSIGSALNQAIISREEGEMVLVTGSLYTVGEALSWLREKRGKGKLMESDIPLV